MACDACAHAESKLCALRSLSQLPAAKRRERRKRRAGRLAQPLTKQKLEGLLKPPPSPASDRKPLLPRSLGWAPLARGAAARAS